LPFREDFRFAQQDGFAGGGRQQDDFEVVRRPILFTDPR
jgi:hypothetical protein